MPWKEILEIAPRWIWRFVAVGALVLVAIQMSRGDALRCPNGAIFAKSCDSPAVTVEIPDHAVVAFNRAECPTGWRDYRDASGRFIVGIGRHSQHDQYGFELAELELGDTGGSRTHRLTEPEMPTHTHEYVFSDGYDSPRHTDTSVDEFGDKNRTQDTTPTGGGARHNNMPPFVALRFCELVSESTS